MILAIKTVKQWYCKECKKVHDILYFVSKNKSYCEDCVPIDIKEKSVLVNQNRKRID